MCSPSAQMGMGGGFSMEALLETVSSLEKTGLLEDFVRAHPNYALGVEVTLAILHGNRNNNRMLTMSGGGAVNGPMTPCSRPQTAPPSGGGCCRRFVPSAPPQMAGGCAMARSPQMMGPPRPGMPPQSPAAYGAAPSPSGFRGPPQGQPSMQSQFQQRPPAYGAPPQSETGVVFPQPGALDLTLEQRLAMIPIPNCTPCSEADALSALPVQTHNLGHHRALEHEYRPTGRSDPCSVGLGIGRGKGGYDPNENKGPTIKCYQEQAGSFSDGIGGHKVRCAQEVADGKAAADRKFGMYDGCGFRKPRAVED